MTEAVTVALIVSVPPTLMAMASLIVGLHNGGKADRNYRVAKSTEGKVDIGVADVKVVKEQTDGLTERLVASTAKASFAEGVKAEQDSPETAEPQPPPDSSP